MSFLVVHDISDSNPYAILKVTNDSTTQDVIKMALEKTGKLHYKADEFVLVEEVDDDSSQMSSQRMVGMEENPLCLREEWRSHGKFVLKKVGADPSWRARLCVSDRDRKQSMLFKSDSIDVIDEADAAKEQQEVRDDFLVCVFNVSPTVAHTIFTASKGSTARQVIQHCLERGRRGELDPNNFVLMEEQEVKEGRGRKGKKLERRILSPDENVYLVQAR